MNPNDELLEDLPADLPEEVDADLNLDDILKEFAEEVPEAEDAPTPEAPAAEPEETPEETIRVELPVKNQETPELSGDTVRFEPVGAEEAAPPPAAPKFQKKEPFTEGWEPDYEQPIGEYVPPQPIVFHPRSRLRELKRKLVAGPEKRYYDLTEIGFGKLQAAIFISILIVLFSACVTVLYAGGMIPESRIKLMVFLQFLSMLVSALLGCYQMIDGVADLFKLRFSLNTMLLFAFIACLSDGILGLRELRVPCCAVFSLHVTMSLLSTYHRRQTELWQMDTMRKAIHLDSIVPSPEYHDGKAGLLRGEGQVEDFMDNYAAVSGPEKVLHVYAFLATLASIGISVAAGLLHSSFSFAVQVLSVTLLVAVPVSSFVSFSRPMAVLERRLHKLGTVLCGWQGVKRMAGKAFFPVSHKDLFPVGSCKMNGVKFYGHRDPDQVVAYSTALILADGSGLGSLFEQLLSSRSGRHYDAVNYRAYPNGGIGAEVCQEPVLMGSLAFLQEMGVEIPEGINVNNAIYTAVDGELCGVFAITYSKAGAVASGLGTLCSYRRLRPVLISCDFILTEKFMKELFGINPRRFFFPERAVRQELQAKTLPEDPTVAAALVTTEGLAPFAYAVTGARAIRTAAIAGTAVHMVGGILGLLIMLALAVLGEAALLTPVNLLAFELIWLIPGLLITEWTRAV